MVERKGKIQKGYLFAALAVFINLYIGAWCLDSEPEKIKQHLAPRGTSAPDNVDLFIDSYHDHRTGYKFSVSPTGVQVDELRYDDVKRDQNWTGIWYSAGSVDDKGWFDEDDSDISRKFEFNDRTLILKISYFFNI